MPDGTIPDPIAPQPSYPPVQETTTPMFTPPGTPPSERPDGVMAQSGDSNKKRNRMILAGLATFVLVVGTISTILLVQRNQELREKAASGSSCDQSPDCDLLNNPGNTGNYTAPRNIMYVDITNQASFRYNTGNTNDGCYDVSIQGNKLTWNRVGSGNTCKDISNVQVWMGNTTSTPTTPPGQSPTPTTPAITAACGEVEAYDLQWNKLTSAQLAQKKAGEKIRYAVAGTASSGSFDKAKFAVNGTDLGETTTKKPGSDAFYVEYTIPSGTTNFNVTAQVHHSTLGWF